MKKLLLATVSAVVLSIAPSLGAASVSGSEKSMAKLLYPSYDWQGRMNTGLKAIYDDFNKSPETFSVIHPVTDAQALVNKRLQMAAMTGMIDDVRDLLNPAGKSLMPNQDGINVALSAAVSSASDNKSLIISSIFTNQSGITPDQQGVNVALINLALDSTGSLYKHAPGVEDVVLSGASYLLSDTNALIPDETTIMRCYLFLKDNDSSCGGYEKALTDILVPYRFRNAFDKLCADAQPLEPIKALHSFR